MTASERRAFLLSYGPAAQPVPARIDTEKALAATQRYWRDWIGRFDVTREDGNIPLDIPGFGLFYRDTCYLGGYALSLHDTNPLLLMSADGEGMAAQIELTNSALSANGIRIPDHKLSLRRTLLVSEDGPTFADTIRLENG